MHKSAIGLYSKSIRAISDEFYFKIVADLLESLDLVYEVDTKYGPLKFHCGSETVRIRASNMFTREPATIEWIEGFGKGDTLWDVGSNVGVFTLYSVLARDAKVVAFEPLPWNHTGLVQNLVLNGFTDNVLPVQAAVNDETTISVINVHVERGDIVGASDCPFGEPYGNMGNPVETKYRIQTIGYSIDDFVERFDVPFPNHLKVDVDGIEMKVISGARKTIKDPRMRSIMIEVEPGQHEFFEKELGDNGYNTIKIAPVSDHGTDDFVNEVVNVYYSRD